MSFDRFRPPARADEMSACEGCGARTHFSGFSNLPGLETFCLTCASVRRDGDGDSEQSTEGKQ